MKCLTVSLAALALAPGLSAQEDYSAWETETEVGATLVLAPGLTNDGDERDPEAALYEISLGGRVERVLDSGVTIGARGILRAQRDHPARPGGAGVLVSNELGVAPGVLTGLSLEGMRRETGPRGSLEAAYIYVDGGYGEVTLGRDSGVLARFHEGDVSVLSAARLASPYLDPSGLGAIHTRPDITGPSAKISYVTPRILGVRLGGSFTPELEARGLDRAPPIPGVDLKNTWEIGANATRRLRESGLRFRVGLGYARSEIEAEGAQLAIYGAQSEAWFAGGELEYDAVRIGINWLRADEGRFSDSPYTAWSAGVAREWDDWAVSATYGASDAGIGEVSGDGVSLAVSRAINSISRVSVAYQDRSLDTGPLGGKDVSSQGIVVEITLNLEN